MNINEALQASPIGAALQEGGLCHPAYFFVTLGSTTYYVADSGVVEHIQHEVWRSYENFEPLTSIPAWAVSMSNFVKLWNKHHGPKFSYGPYIVLQQRHMIGAGCCSHCCKYDGPIFLVRLGWSSQTTTVRFCRDCLIDTVGKIASDIGFQKISRQTRAAKKPKKVTKRKRVKR